MAAAFKEKVDQCQKELAELDLSSTEIERSSAENIVSSSTGEPETEAGSCDLAAKFDSMIPLSVQQTNESISSIQETDQSAYSEADQSGYTEPDQSGYTEPDQSGYTEPDQSGYSETDHSGYGIQQTSQSGAEGGASFYETSQSGEDMLRNHSKSSTILKKGNR